MRKIKHSLLDIGCEGMLYYLTEYEGVIPRYACSNTVNTAFRPVLLIQNETHAHRWVEHEYFYTLVEESR